ncbi:MAG: hypothetical protein ABH832_03995 [bacterium]
MRQILNVSLPLQMANDIKKEVKKGKFSSVSEFIRHIYRQWEENMIHNELIKGKQEFTKGKDSVLNSLKDLR